MLIHLYTLTAPGEYKENYMHSESGMPCWGRDLAQKLPVQKHKNNSFTNLRWAYEAYRFISAT